MYCSDNGIYPHRTASFFSTISRCIDLIEQDELELGVTYDAVVSTRLDVINGIQITSTNIENWWKKAAMFDMVGAKKVTGLVDDRFFFGRRNAMSTFKHLYNSFQALYSQQTNSPERMLYKFVSIQRPPLAMAPILDFVVFAKFEVNKDKYSTKFKSSIENQLGLESVVARTKEDRVRACAHIHSPLAHNQCMQIDR